MKEFAVEVINKYGYLGILILTIIESIFPIIPAEFILTLGGFATTVTEVTKSGVVLFATIGELIGALILYIIGRSISYERLQKLLSGRIGRLTHISKADIEKSKDWFLLKGKYTVLFSKCIPVVGSLISIPAGMVHMNILVFILFTFIGISIWNTILVFFGVTIKKSLDILLAGSSASSMTMALIFLVCFIIVVVNVLLNREHDKKRL